MRGTLLNRTRREAIDFAFQLDGITRMHPQAVLYHNPYPNGGGIPRPMDQVVEDLLDAVHDTATPDGDGYGEQWDCVGAVFTVMGCDRVRLAPPWPFYVDKKRGIGYCNCNTAIQDAGTYKTSLVDLLKGRKGEYVPGPQLLFSDATKLPGGPVAGDLVCFGRSLTSPHGHIGFLVGGGKVLHCSPSNKRKYGRALAITDASIFLNRKDRRYLRYNHWAVP